MKECQINNSGNFVPYKDYSSTSAVQMRSTSSDPLSLTEIMLLPVIHEEINVEIDMNIIPIKDIY